MFPTNQNILYVSSTKCTEFSTYNKNISTQDFMDHLNDMRLDPDTIRDNVDNNLIEEILAGLISKVLLDMEIKNLDLQLSEKNLGRTIKNNKNFLDDDKKFSRIK